MPPRPKPMPPVVPHPRQVKPRCVICNTRPRTVQSFCDRCIRTTLGRVDSRKAAS